MNERVSLAIHDAYPGQHLFERGIRADEVRFPGVISRKLSQQVALRLKVHTADDLICGSPVAPIQKSSGHVRNQFIQAVVHDNHGPQELDSFGL